MRQKSVPEKEPATQVVKNIRVRRGDTFRPKTRSASYWKGFAARTVSPSSAAARGLSKISITAGRKTFLRPGRGDWLATRPGPQHRTRSKTYVARPAR